MSLAINQGPVMLWGMQPSSYAPDTLTEQRQNMVRGMHGLYRHETGLFQPTSLMETLGFVGIRDIVALQFGDGDGTSLGVIAVYESYYLNDKAYRVDLFRMLEGHVGHQMRAPYPATYDGVLQSDSIDQLRTLETERALDSLQS